MGHIHRGMGHHETKTITLNVNNGTQHLNCFVITGTVIILEVCGFIKTATTLTNCTAAYFNVWDGTVRTAMTKNDGVLSGLGVESGFFKTAADNVTMTVHDNSAASYTEPTSGVQAFVPGIITDKTGVGTYIAFSYTSTDAPVDATIEACVQYSILNGGTLNPA
jgi:hypothetical protein